MLLTACTTAGDDGDGEVVGQLAQCLVGIALFHTVVVHRGEEYLTGTALLSLMSPLEESTLGTLTTTFQVTMPAVFIQTGVDGTDTHLRAETTGDLADQFRSADGGRVYTHLVGTGIEQPFYIGQLIHATAYGEGDIDLTGHTGHHLREGLTTLERGGDVEKAQFVGALFAIGLAQFHRVARTPQVHEVRAFNGLAVLDIQTGYDSFC